jgi:hypothetical protein
MTYARAVARDGGNAAGGAAVDIFGAVVTYLKPAVDSDSAGFFVQVSAQGPAIFVAVNPTTLTPTPKPGDVVSFRATALGTLFRLAQITALTSWKVATDGGVSVVGLVQNLSGATDLVSNLDGYESELVELHGTIDGGFVTRGGYETAFFATTALASANVRVRLASALRDDKDVGPTCDVNLGPAPLWRQDSQAQPSAWMGPDLTVNSCGPLAVVAARAAAGDKVRVAFSRKVLAASVLTDGTQFVLDGGLTASAAAVAARHADVTTSSQDAGLMYSVTVASTVTDLLGGALGAANTATFCGYDPGLAVVISQIYGAAGTSPNSVVSSDYVELHNRGAMAADVSGWTIQYQAAASRGTWTGKATLPPGSIIAAGGFFLVGLKASSVDAGAPLPTPDFVDTGIDISATTGKLALVNGAAVLSTPDADAGCSSLALGCSVMDLVGFGATANCSETVNAPAPSATTAIFRANDVAPNVSCVDTNTNGSDFYVGAPAPRNSTSAVQACTGI